MTAIDRSQFWENPKGNLIHIDNISDSVRIVSTKPYIRVYERGIDGKYNQIVLDFASI